MPIKLVTVEQFQLLKEGDIIDKHSVNEKKGNRFDDPEKMEITKYEIRTINHKKGSLSLKIADSNMGIFTWPEDEERLNTNCSNLISEDIWWVCIK